MIEKMPARGVSQIELARVISSDFDDHVIGFYVEGNFEWVSSGVDPSVLEAKGRLLGSLSWPGNLDQPGFSSSDTMQQENMQLRSENLMLRNAVRHIEERLAVIETSLPQVKTVVLREISKEEAEAEILELFSEGEVLYYSDIADRLGLDLPSVVDICNELGSKGEIEVVDGTLQSR